jgi:hypothetical protein
VERVRTPELMDEPGVARAELAGALEYIRAVNRRLGGTRALLKHLRRWSVGWPRDRAVTLLDVATGSADLPVAAREWAMKAGFDLRVTGVDVHPTTLEIAQEYVAGCARGRAELVRAADGSEAITLMQADALRLMERFKAGSFDYVHAGLFLHHLPEIEILTVLRIMDRLAARGVIWNDLVRSRVGYAAIHVLTWGRPRMVRHDARVSVRAGFTRREALDLTRRSGIDYGWYSWNVLTHRFTVAGERGETVRR